MSVNGMYWNENVDYPEYDPEGAKELLTEAGYGDGFEITLALDSGNTIHATMGTLLKEQWAEVGITLNLETLEKGTINERMNNLTLDLQIRPCGKRYGRSFPAGGLQLHL